MRMLLPFYVIFIRRFRFTSIQGNFVCLPGLFLLKPNSLFYGGRIFPQTIMTVTGN